MMKNRGVKFFPAYFFNRSSKTLCRRIKHSVCPLSKDNRNKLASLGAVSELYCLNVKKREIFYQEEEEKMDKTPLG